MTYALIFIIIFATIVVVHEWGHFIVAKKNGVAVNEFAIGMGPKIWSTKKEETLYTIRLLPIGGYCAMEGENEESCSSKALTSKTPLQRIAIFAAGALMNVLLTWILMTLFLGYSGYRSNVIDKIVPDSPIEKAGVVADEIIVAIDDVKVKTQQQISEAVSTNKEVYKLTIQATDGTIRNLEITPQVNEDGSKLLGFYSKMGHYNAFEVIWQGLKETIVLLKEVVKGFVMLITGNVSIDELAGIVGVAQITTEVWDVSVQESIMTAIMNMVRIAALLSANLAVLNLLPFPALDGGRIFFTLIELVRGKPLSQQKEAAIHFMGFVLLMVLMVVVLYNDIMRLVA
ncbi:MAG: hypothetical protein BEN19_02470 [Epulopiscium sp. Nuni2H_MBin003]|nr:MAG: hypothetical protein BEN19_02470 [Epulopiscium sp. Nuni2H_MBin003]